jgi:heat shock protein HslJ
MSLLPSFSVKFSTLALFVVICATFFASCGLLTSENEASSKDQQEQHQPKSLPNTGWQLESFEVQNGPTDKIDRSEEQYILSFGKEPVVEAVADCNKCRGEYSYSEDDSISISLSCSREACNRSAEFSGALNVADTYTMKDSVLQILYTDPISEKDKILNFTYLDPERE